jgi:hypothetical protein
MKHHTSNANFHFLGGGTLDMIKVEVKAEVKNQNKNKDWKKELRKSAQ